MELLSSGAHSDVFISDEEPGIIIKKQKNPEKDSAYAERQMRGYDIVNNIRAKNKNTGVVLPELVDIQQEDNATVIREKRLTGKAFDKEGKTYSALSKQEKNYIALQMATFLNAMHSSYDCKPATKSIKTMFNGKLNNADDIIAKFEGKLPKNIANRLKQAEKSLAGSDISDEFTVMTHSDLRGDNLMYDKKTHKLSVLDFELAGMKNVYRDFVANAAATSMPWDFTKRVIDYYNKIPDKKYPITINPEKVQNMLFYGAMHEYARCIRPGDNENATKKDIKKMYTRLTNVTGITFNNTSRFKQGRRNITEKMFNVGTIKDKLYE